MSGLIAAFRGDGAPVEPAPVFAMLRALAHRGPDGARIAFRPGAALGHRHFFTTPEEVGEVAEDQPVSSQTAGVDLMLDGRVDNRDELLADLDLPKTVSDASLLLAGWLRWGEGLLPRIVGPFALAVFDRRARTLYLARDVMGQRPLCTWSAPDLFLAASEETAILAYPGVPRRLDDHYLALFFVYDLPRDGRTAFHGVRELLPGHVQTVSPRGQSTRRFLTPDTHRRLRYRDEREYAEHYRELLERSVVCRLRAVGPVSAMLSGGLDSTAVAALAATELKARGRGNLRSFSWVFDEVPGCERRWIRSMVERFQLDATYVLGDGLWPLRDPKAGVVSNTPWMNPFALLKDAVYKGVARRGGRTILHGAAGDTIYSGADDWLVDLLRDGHPLAAARALRGLPLSDPGLRRLGRVMLKGGRPDFSDGSPGEPWLTTYARHLLEDVPGWDPAGQDASRPEQYEFLFGSSGRLGPIENPLASARGVEMRDPYRDRRLAELVLSLPAHQLKRPGKSKYVHRQALARILPDEILTRREITLLDPLFDRGFLDRELDTALSLLRRPDAIWRRFIREDFLFDFFPARMAALPDSRELMVPWQCVSSQIWTDHLANSPPERKIIDCDEGLRASAAA